MSRSLAQWLSYQERVNVRSIELGLDRVRAVWQRMGSPRPAPRVITVGGTNGKGSTVAMLEAMLTAAGRRVGCFTSPHLLAYNERIRIDGVDVEDAALVASFERIESARLPDSDEAIALTYFEFGTLAALDLFSRANLDVAVLEVGLGGRLDAVNIIDADVAVITTVDLDHQEWLGDNRDSIGREKAGIARAGRPAVVGDAEPPHGLLDALKQAGARVEQAGADFEMQRLAQGWRWHHRSGLALILPDPGLIAPVQYTNAATAIAALHALDWNLLEPDASRHVPDALRQVSVPGRLQCLGGSPPLYVDVAHNPQAARALAQWLDIRALPGERKGRVYAVFGALSGKDVSGVMQAIGARVDHWHLLDLTAQTPRGLTASALAQCLQQAVGDATFDLHDDACSALAAARADASPADLVLAFGSFFVVSAVLAEAAH